MRRSQPYLRRFTAEFITPEGVVRGDFYGRTDVAAGRRAENYASSRGWTFMSLKLAAWSNGEKPTTKRYA